MQKPKIHILLLSYYWPPAGGPGVQRWVKLSKYLNPDLCRITVISPDPKKASFPVTDHSIHHEAEHIKLIHTDTSEPFAAYKKISGEKNIPIGGFSNQGKKTLVKKIMMGIRGNFFIPDARKGWIPYAVEAASKVMDNDPAQILISTGPPHSTHLAALKIKQKYGIKWMADFRDMWTHVYYNKDLMRSPFARKYDMSLEKKVLENADRVLTVSPGTKKGIDQPYKGLFLDKIEVLFNGFDAADMGPKQPIKDDKLRLAFTGTISERFDYRAFTDGLDLFAEQHPEAQWEWRIAGIVPPYIHEKMAKWENRFVYEGYVPHERSVQVLKEANLLYYVIGNSEEYEGIIGGKIFEYLGAGRKILHAMPPHFDAYHFLEKMNAQLCPKENTKEAWAEYLWHIYQHKELLQPEADMDTELQEYTREAIAGKLFKMIEKLLK